MSKFRIDDEVTLKKRVHWSKETGLAGQEPKFGVVYKVVEVLRRDDGRFYIVLENLHPDDMWSENAFEKVVSDLVLHAELETVPEPYTI
jgi:hypothetical protein